ncbi:MAG: hypothetical protein RLZZ53_1481 [Acidobacteriota bacterium]|jgi:hypothetical protein
MGRLTSTLLLVVVLAGLGGYIYFVDSKRPAAGPDGAEALGKVFTVEADKINELRISYQAESALLKKDNSGWKLVEPIQVEADPPEAIGVTTALNNIDIVRVVDENPSDLAQFGLANPNIIVSYKTENGGAGTLKLGNKNATQGELYAQMNDEKRVFLVNAFQESSFNKTPFNLRDKKILKFDRDNADSLVLSKGATAMELARTGSDWKVVKPVPSRSDFAAVEGFITRLSSANMSQLIEGGDKELAKYGLDKPSMTVTVGSGSSKTVLEVGATEGGATYAHDPARALVFTVDSTMQTDLNKNFDDYRKKEVFEFRPFTLAKLRAVLDAPGGPKTYEFEKQKPATPADPETWKVTRVGGASHVADQATMDDLLTKLVEIKADSFVASAARTGLDKPALVVSASFDEGKFERVRFGQGHDDAFALRDGETGVAKINMSSLAVALRAFDVAVTPKETAPAPAADAKK